MVIVANVGRMEIVENDTVSELYMKRLNFKKKTIFQLELFNHIGCCLGVKGTRAVVDRLRSDAHKKAISWRDALSVSIHYLLLQV